MFIKICGLEGKVYVPGSETTGCKKHSCKDCFSCQMCSDERCALCIGHKENTRGRENADGRD